MSSSRYIRAHVDPADLVRIITQYTAPTAFISRWSVKSMETIQLPFVQHGQYDCIVDWGDNSSTTHVTAAWQGRHLYLHTGLYTITITGRVCGFSFQASATDNHQNLTSIEQWGDLLLGDGGGYFSGCVGLEYVSDVDIPDLRYTTTTRNMFRNAVSLVGGVSDWDVSTITDMAGMFRGATVFNSNLEDWDVSHVTKTTGMFSTAKYFNSNLERWDMSSVKDISFMFFEASGYRYGDRLLRSWDLCRIPHMQYAFYGVPIWNIPSWYVDGRVATYGCFGGGD